MPISIAWLWVAAGVLFFWGIGAHNRLVRLRADVGRAFALLDRQLVNQMVWLGGFLPEALRGEAPSALAELEGDEVHAAWRRLGAASDQLAAALAQARSAQPPDVPGMASLVMAHEALRNAWSGALADAVPAGAVPSAERLQARWLRLLHQSLPLRAAYNDAAQRYNDAIAQRPAATLARLLSFHPAGLATRLGELK